MSLPLDSLQFVFSIDSLLFVFCLSSVSFLLVLCRSSVGVVSVKDVKTNILSIQDK